MAKKKKKKRSLLQRLPSLLAKAEGGKSSISIGNAREAIKLIAIVLALEPKALSELLRDGFKHLQRSRPAVKKVKLALRG